MAKDEGDHWLLNGTKSWITNGYESEAGVVRHVECSPESGPKYCISLNMVKHFLLPGFCNNRPLAKTQGMYIIGT